MNSRVGGTLLIGVADDGSVSGLASDYLSLHKAGKDDRDLFRLHLGNIVSQSMGEAAAANMTAQIHTVDGADVCRVHVRPSGFPVDATVIVDKQRSDGTRNRLLRPGRQRHQEARRGPEGEVRGRTVGKGEVMPTYERRTLRDLLDTGSERHPHTRHAGIGTYPGQSVRTAERPVRS